jgi:hypothetical protein
MNNNASVSISIWPSSESGAMSSLKRRNVSIKKKKENKKYRLGFETRDWFLPP